MANPLLLDIVNYFITNGQGTADGVDMFRDYSPEEPSNIIMLYEYPGAGGVYYDDLVARSVQVSVRNESASAAQTIAKALYLLLKSATTRIDFSAERWGLVDLNQPPFKIDEDQNNRITYGFNIGINTTID